MSDNIVDTGAQQEQGTEHPDKALIEKWNKRLEADRKTPEYKKYLADIEKHRKYVRGEIGEDGNGGLVRANLVYATLAGLLPHIYAKNPEVAITPSEAVDQANYQLVKGLAQTMELVLNRMFDDAELKKRAKGSVRCAMTSRIGWVKVTYQRDIKTDPIILSRISDVQDNLKRIDALIAQCENDELAMQECEAKKAELKNAVAALEKQVEVTVAEGLCIDRLQPEDVVWDQNVRDFDVYYDCGYIAHRNWYSKDEYLETFDKDPDTHASTYIGRNESKKSQQSKPSEDEAQYAVWEIWHLGTNTILTMCEGAQEWPRDPFQVTEVGEQWYPFFPLGLHLVDGQMIPLSSVGFLTELQDEYNTTRTQFADLRAKNKPHYITSSETPEKDIKRKTLAEIGEVVIVDANGKPLKDVFDVAPMLRIDPAQYDTSPIRADFDFMSGLPDAARGGIVKAKTATEADYLQAGLASRTDEMQDAIEDWIRSIAKYSIEILLQVLTLQQVQRIAGPKAVWPQMNKEMIFDLVQIEIRAGTSGKPNKQQELKTWVEFLPRIQELMAQIAKLREAGQNQQADALVALSRETIRRLDERIDIEEFLPQKQEDDQDPQQMMAMQQQLEAAQKQLEKMEAEIRKLNAEAHQTEVETVIEAGQAMVPASEGRMLQ